MAKSRKKQKPPDRPSEKAKSASPPIPTPVPTLIPQPLPKDPGKVVRHEIREMYVGPLPPPKTLAEYDKIVPKLAENIVLWATNEQKHRHTMEGELLTLEKNQAAASIKDSRTGLFFGFVLTLAAFSTAWWFAWLGHPWAGAAVFSGTLLGIIWCFIFGSKVRLKDSLQQMQQVVSTANGNTKADPARHAQIEEQQAVTE